MPSENRSSTSRRPARPPVRGALLVGLLAAGTAVAVAGIATGSEALAAAGAAGAVAVAVVAVGILGAERRAQARIDSELVSQESFLEELTQAIDAIAAPSDPDGVLEEARCEAERIFGGTATLLPADSASGVDGQAIVPFRGRSGELATLHLRREPALDRTELVRLNVLADFAARTAENARLVEQTQDREAERARLSDQLITAEQEERRRIALFLHDGPVQNLAGIALMLDASVHSIESGKLDEASRVIGSALERHRETIRSLRDLSFNLEPVVLRDQGFGPAVRELTGQLGISNEIQIDLQVDAADTLAEKAQIVLYQIIREALNQAVRRGPPTRISIAIGEQADGSIETVIADDGGTERRRASFDAIAERARTLNGQVNAETGDEGTTVHVVLPTYTAKG